MLSLYELQKVNIEKYLNHLPHDYLNKLLNDIDSMFKVRTLLDANIRKDFYCNKNIGCIAGALFFPSKADAINAFSILINSNPEFLDQEICYMQNCYVMYDFDINLLTDDILENLNECNVDFIDFSIFFYLSMAKDCITKILHLDNIAPFDLSKLIEIINGRKKTEIC